jgi:hypothetical protein
LDRGDELRRTRRADAIPQTGADGVDCGRSCAPRRTWSSGGSSRAAISRDRCGQSLAKIGITGETLEKHAADCHADGFKSHISEGDSPANAYAAELSDKA